MDSPLPPLYNRRAADAASHDVPPVTPSLGLGVKTSNPKDVIGSGKAPMSTVSMRVMQELGVAMAEGAAKYGRHNYRQAGVRASVYFDAAMRHLMDWWEGEDLDPDSGNKLSHVTKAIASLTVLRDSMLYGNWTDDRPPATAPLLPYLNAVTKQIMALHKDKHPVHYTNFNIQGAVNGLQSPPSSPQPK